VDYKVLPEIGREGRYKAENAFPRESQIRPTITNTIPLAVKYRVTREIIKGF